MVKLKVDKAVIYSMELSSADRHEITVFHQKPVFCDFPDMCHIYDNSPAAGYKAII